jgi:hypothetical protein
VAVVASVTPTSGRCSTDFQFVAHFTINSGAKYRWHWVFGGPNNYSATSGDHDQDRTGDVKVTKKFDPKVPGTYWAQVQITDPVTAASNPTSVQVTC